MSWKTSEKAENSGVTKPLSHFGFFNFTRGHWDDPLSPLKEDRLKKGVRTIFS